MSYFEDASLVLIPSGIKDQKVYSIKPTDGSGDLTFSRASNATRVNSSGLVEKVRENLLLQSNSFDTTWVPSNVSVTGGQAGYDGSNDAWLMNITGGTSSQRVNQTISASGVLTLSVYAKAGTLNWISVRGDAPAVSEAYFNLATGTLGSLVGSAIDSSIESVGSGWYRCSVSFVDTTIVRIYLASGDVNVNQSSGNVYLQDAQLESGDIATSYIPTTTASVSTGPVSGLPRLDYSGGASCPSLLLEPQRTNLLPYSNFNASTWTQTDASISVNSATSPDGYQNAHTATRTSSSNKRVGVAVFSGVAGQPFTTSIYLRKVSGSGIVSYADVNNTATTFTLTNEWQRYSVTATASTSALRLYVDLSQDGDVVEFYEAQIEQGAYSTSLIPTLSSAVTRVADSASKTGISSLIGQTEGTLFIDVVPNDLSNLSRYISIEAAAGVGSGWIGIFASGSNTFRFYGDGWDFSAGAQVRGTRYKLAMAYKNGVLTSAYINGTSVGTLTANTTGKSYANLKLANATIGNFGCCDFFQSIIFPTALSNAQLAELTA